MRAVGFLARLEVRRHWRRMLVVAVMVGVVGAVVLATVAGARRTATSLDRFRRESRTADVELAVAGVPTDAQLRMLRRAPRVRAVGLLRAYGIQIPRLPSLQAIGVPTGDAVGTAVDRARIVDGRAIDPSAANEVAVGESLARRLHVGVGSTIRAESYTPAQIDAILHGVADVGGFAGPKVALRVVGIERRPADLSNRAVSGGFLVLSPAFTRVYEGRVGAFGSYVRLRGRNGATDAPALIRLARRTFGDSLFNAQGLNVETEGTRDAIHVLTLTLWIVAAVAALAGAVAVGIVLAREIAAVTAGDSTLRALGVTRRQRVGMCWPYAMTVAVGGALVAVTGAVALSPLFPTGVARRADPDVGLHADGFVLALGAAATLVAVVTLALGAALRATTRTDAQARDERRRTSTVADAAARLGVVPTATNGLRMAFDRGRGRSAVPVRSAFVASAMAVLGVTAVLVFGSNLGHLVDTPARYGAAWDLKTQDVTANTPCNDVDHGLSGISGLAAVTEVCYENVQVDGRPVPGLAFARRTGTTIDPVVVEGRAPRSRSEIALGSKTLDALHKHVGDSVEVRGREQQRRFRVVGRVTLAALGQAQPLADGATFTWRGFEPLFDPNLFSRYFVARFARGADTAAVERRIAAVPQLEAPTGPSVPVEVDRIRQVRWFPIMLAVLLGALGLLAVGHAIVTSVRRRRVELALLRTLGFERSQVRATVAWQATTLAAVGLVVGIPVGVVAGRLAWRAVANGLGVSTTTTVTPVVLLAIPTAVVLVNLVAWLPARASTRVRPAVALHTE